MNWTRRAVWDYQRIRRFIWTTFLDSICVCYCMILGFLFLTYLALYDRLCGLRGWDWQLSLPCVRKMASGNLLWIPGGSAWCSVMTWRGGIEGCEGVQERGDGCMHTADSLCEKLAAKTNITVSATLPQFKKIRSICWWAEGLNSNFCCLKKKNLGSLSNYPTLLSLRFFICWRLGSSISL